MTAVVIVRGGRWREGRASWRNEGLLSMRIVGLAMAAAGGEGAVPAVGQRLQGGFRVISGVWGWSVSGLGADCAGREARNWLKKFRSAP